MQHIAVRLADGRAAYLSVHAARAVELCPYTVSAQSIINSNFSQRRMYTLSGTDRVSLVSSK